MSNDKIVDGLTENEMTDKVNQFVKDYSGKLNSLYADALSSWLEHIRGELGDSKEADLSILLGILHTTVLVGTRCSAKFAQQLPLKGEGLREAFTETMEQVTDFIVKSELADTESPSCDPMDSLREALEAAGIHGMEISDGGIREIGGSEPAVKKTVH